MNNTQQRKPTKSLYRFSNKFLRTVELQTVLIELETFVLKYHKISQVFSTSQKLKSSMEKEIKEIDKTLREYKDKMPLLFEMLFTDKVNTFLYYISDVMLEIYHSKPELLSNKKIDFYKIIKTQNITEVIRDFAEETIINIMHQNFGNIVQVFSNKFKIQICQNKTEEKRISNAIEIRNLLVHNNGIINSKFLKKTKLQFTRGKKIKITKDYFKEVSDILVGAAFRTDEQTIRNFFS